MSGLPSVLSIDVQIFPTCRYRLPIVRSTIKGTGMLVRNFEKNPQEVTRSCFMGVA